MITTLAPYRPCVIKCDLTYCLGWISWVPKSNKDLELWIPHAMRKQESSRKRFWASRARTCLPARGKWPCNTRHLWKPCWMRLILIWIATSKHPKLREPKLECCALPTPSGATMGLLNASTSNILPLPIGCLVDSWHDLKALNSLPVMRAVQNSDILPGQQGYRVRHCVTHVIESREG